MVPKYKPQLEHMRCLIKSCFTAGQDISLQNDLASRYFAIKYFDTAAGHQHLNHLLPFQFHLAYEQLVKVVIKIFLQQLSCISNIFHWNMMEFARNIVITEHDTLYTPVILFP